MAAVCNGCSAAARELLADRVFQLSCDLCRKFGVGATIANMQNRDRNGPRYADLTLNQH